MEAYSQDTNTTYPDWAALVAAEGSGWVAVAIITRSAPAGSYSWPYVWGPYPTKGDAKRARARLKYRFKKEGYPDGVTVSYFVRPAWKEGGTT